MKLDKLIKSLEACVPQDEACQNCAYAKYDTFECIQKMHEDALTTLKMLQPKPYESRKKLPCTCGKSRIEQWSGYDKNKLVTAFICHNCGKKASGYSEIEAVRAWNDMIKKEMESAND